MMLAALLLCLQTPDVVVFVLDDVATKDIQLYGGAAATPYIDGLAASGVRFTRAYVNPTCATTRRSLQTGHWWITGNGTNNAVDANTPALAEVFLPEGMPGYGPAFFGKWHLGYPQTGSFDCVPATQGYTYAYEWMPGNAAGDGGTSYTDWERHQTAPGGCESSQSTLYEPFVVADKFVKGWPKAQSPKMSVVNINLAHSPFHRPPAYLLPPEYPETTTQRARYEAMITSYDLLIGYMLTVVDLETTTVMVVGDNGTPPNVAGLDSAKSKGTTFERGVRVPCVISGGLVANGGRDASDLVHAVDLWATCVALAGGTATSDGVSLLPVLADEAHGVPHEYILVGNAWGTDEGDRASISDDGYKLRQLDTDGDGDVDVEEFYDLDANPAETVNLIADPDHATRINAHRAFIEAEAP